MKNNLLHRRGKEIKILANLFLKIKHVYIHIYTPTMFRWNDLTNVLDCIFSKSRRAAMKIVILYPTFSTNRIHIWELSGILLSSFCCTNASVLLSLGTEIASFLRCSVTKEYHVKGYYCIVWNSSFESSGKRSGKLWNSVENIDNEI